MCRRPPGKHKTLEEEMSGPSGVSEAQLGWCLRTLDSGHGPETYIMQSNRFSPSTLRSTSRVNTRSSPRKNPNITPISPSTTRRAKTRGIPGSLSPDNHSTPQKSTNLAIATIDESTPDPSLSKRSDGIETTISTTPIAHLLARSVSVNTLVRTPSPSGREPSVRGLSKLLRAHSTPALKRQPSVVQSSPVPNSGTETSDALAFSVRQPSGVSTCASVGNLSIFSSSPMKAKRCKLPEQSAVSSEDYHKAVYGTLFGAHDSWIRAQLRVAGRGVLSRVRLDKLVANRIEESRVEQGGSGSQLRAQRAHAARLRRAVSQSRCLTV